MARGVNKVILIGNLGDEPNYRTTSSGTAVTNISMVTNEVRRNIETGQYTELAEWHRVVMWNKLAEIAHQYLHKGSQIYIEGKLRTRSYTDKQGVKRTITEIVADEMQMLGTRASNGMSGDMNNTYGGSSYSNQQSFQNDEPNYGYNQEPRFNNQRANNGFMDRAASTPSPWQDNNANDSFDDPMTRAPAQSANTIDANSMDDDDPLPF